MNEVFISYIEEDRDIALELALEIEKVGCSTWCYELDSLPGLTYFRQTRSAVANAKVVAVIISERSLGSQQIERELVRAFELRKGFIPILRDITYAEFQERQPEWADILGATTSVRLPADGVAALAPRVCEGLRGLGVPASEPSVERIAKMEAILRSPIARHAPRPSDASSPPRSEIDETPQRPVPRISARVFGRKVRLALLALVGVVFTGAALSLRHATEQPLPPTTLRPADKSLVIGVMDIRAQGPVPEWMREFTRDGMNLVLSKAPNLKVISKQMIDFVREKRGLKEIDAAKRLGITKMISGTLTAKGSRFVLAIQVTDIRTGVLEDSEQVEGREEDLVDLQNRAALNMVRAMKVALNPDDLNRMFARTNDLDTYKLLDDTLGIETTGPTRPGDDKPPRQGAVFSWSATAWAGDTNPEEAAVRGLLEKYRTALEAKDLDQLAAIQEEMGDGQRQALTRYFENASSLKIKFTDLDILLEGDEALATFTRDDVFKDVRSGRDMHLEVRISSVLAKQAGGWKIRALKKPS